MEDVIIAGTGISIPTHIVTNDMLVDAFNTYVTQFNELNHLAIERGEVVALQPSSSAFILKASGIEARRFIAPEGILDPNRMKPVFKNRALPELSYQAELAIPAIEQALAQANLKPGDIDGIIVASTNMERPYPGIAIELQHHFGMRGFGFDMQVACSSATFGLHTASAMIKSGSAKRMLVVGSELCSTQLDFTNRDSHFIFGEAAMCVVLQAATEGNGLFKVVSSKTETTYSTNIRCSASPGSHVFEHPTSVYFEQEGRKVFKEVVPLVVQHITQHLNSNRLQPSDVARFWLHQANANMNQLIVKKLLDKDYDLARAPIVLNRYGNTSSVGSILALHEHADIPVGSYGLLCSFGAGYSVGSLLLQRL